MVACEEKVGGGFYRRNEETCYCDGKDRVRLRRGVDGVRLRWGKYRVRLGWGENLWVTYGLSKESRRKVISFHKLVM